MLAALIEAWLKGIFVQVRQERQADIEELEELPDHIHLLVSSDSNRIFIGSPS